MIQCPVDQPSHRPHPGRMAPAVMAVHLTQRLVATHPTDPVLHHDPTPRERSVVPSVLLRPRLAPWLASRGRSEPLRVPVGDPYVSAVAQRPDATRQAGLELRAL